MVYTRYHRALEFREVMNDGVGHIRVSRYCHDTAGMLLPLGSKLAGFLRF